jgi:ubiquinone/menaquinone biosynthesis C-methylase UbiE
VNNPHVDYVTGDLFVTPGAAHHVEHAVDLEAINFPDGHFDVVIVLHVLEHVNDVHRALREMHRVLRPGGLCV